MPPLFIKQYNLSWEHSPATHHQPLTPRTCTHFTATLQCYIFLANGSFLDNIGDAEHFGKASVCRAVRKFTVELKCLLPFMVLFPGHKPVGSIKEEFHRIAGDWCRNILFFFIIIIYILLQPQSGVSSLISCHFAGLANVIGCIDGTQIPITAPKENKGDYVNRKSLHRPS